MKEREWARTPGYSTVRRYLQNVSAVDAKIKRLEGLVVHLRRTLIVESTINRLLRVPELRESLLVLRSSSHGSGRAKRPTFFLVFYSFARVSAVLKLKVDDYYHNYHIPIPKQTDLPISYNIAPSQKVLTIRCNPETQERSLDALQWGLIPYWAKDQKIAYRTINARAETVDRAPAFRQAFSKRRCLIPADGFYEWRKTAKPKLPYAIAMKDGRPFTFAGLWENWRDPESGEWLRTCTIITGEPNALVAQIHPRMPVILPEQHHAVWLGETEDGNLKELLVPYPADQMRMWEISPRVNSPKNDDPSLWEPLHGEPTQTTTDALELVRENTETA